MVHIRYIKNKNKYLFKKYIIIIYYNNEFRFKNRKF